MLNVASALFCLRQLIWHSSGDLSTPFISFLRFLSGKLSPSHAAELASVSHLRKEDSFSLGILLLLLFLFQLHLGRRLWESIAVAHFSNDSKQHASVTVMGLVYYTLTSLTPVIDSPLLGTPNHGVLTSAASPFYPALPILGATVFAAGFYLQHVQHRILADLRSSGKKSGADKKTDGDSSKEKNSNDPSSSSSSSSSSRYAIPYGSLFRFVSMPHYFCEMVEYTGLWMVAGCKMSQLSADCKKKTAARRSSRIGVCLPVRQSPLLLCLIPFLVFSSFFFARGFSLICVWVYSNLSITAVRSHKWYKETFATSYPKERKAVIPFLL